MLDPALDDRCNDALALVEEGRLREGEERLNELFNRRPDYHMVQYGIGVIAIQRENFESAARHLKRAIELFPDFTEAHFNLGMVCLKLLDIPGMIASFREVVRIGEHPDLVAEAKKRIDDFEADVRKHNGISLDAYLNNMETFSRALQKLEANAFEDAITLFHAVLAVEPDHHQSWGNLGLAYAGLGMKSKAIQCLDKALEIDPQYEVAFVNRAFVERLADGERLDAKIQSVDYVKDYQLDKKNSYLADVIGWMRGKSA